jgi:hypothetical protein
LEPKSAKPSISSEDNLINSADAEDKESIKRLSRAGCENTKADVVVLTECPTKPCAIYYTDTLSQSLLIVCKNPKHEDADMEKK